MNYLPSAAALLRSLLRMQVPQAQRFAVAAGLSRTMMLTVGSSDVVGRRSSASKRLDDTDFRTEHNEDISAESFSPGRPTSPRRSWRA